jgi:hypothetical protein
MGLMIVLMIVTLTGHVAKSVVYQSSCQIRQCWCRYNDGYQKDNKPLAAMASMPSYSVEAPWYFDTGATDHITNDLERLAIHEKYQEKEQIQTVGGSGMPIRHVGHSMIHTPRALHL